jgi:hypothetical protein
MADEQKTDWSPGDRRTWMAFGAVCAVVIAAGDGSLAAGALWMVVAWIGADPIMPAVIGRARRLSDQCGSFYGQVALGWAVYTGPMVGSVQGALFPIVLDVPLSSFECAILGLVLGPVCAAAVGVLLATVVCTGFWLWTGKQLR